MRWTLTCWLLGSVWLSGCKDHAPSPAEIADQGWHAHDLVITAGEGAKSCADAAVVMQRVFSEHKAYFEAAFDLDRDKDRLQEATDFLEAHQDRYGDLETRMEALQDRCAGDTAVQAVFHQMATP
ncbi:MAG TPA: hypothetical protein VGG28_28595 [Kofleriaceae bacterium]